MMNPEGPLIDVSIDEALSYVGKMPDWEFLVKTH
jgi:hypothetical protein